MEVHRPKKPIHGWREFLAEVGIIVVGVLIALAAEQAVEALHWRHQVHEGRKAIREELALSAYFAQERAAVGKCLEDRLAFLQARVDAAGDRWEGQPWRRLQGRAFDEGDAYASPIREWPSEVWRALVADGTAAHFPHKEMLQLSGLYQYVEATRAENSRERAEIAPLAMLGRSFPLGEAARSRIDIALQDQKGMNRMAVLGGAQLSDLLKAARMQPAGDKWDRQMKALQTYAANCEADRPTAVTTQGLPAVD
jgi:hypothetical protein